VKGQMTILDLSITHQKLGKIIIQLLVCVGHCHVILQQMLTLFCFQLTDQKNLEEESHDIWNYSFTHTQNDPAILRTLTAHHTLASTTFTGTSQTPWGPVFNSAIYVCA